MTSQSSLLTPRYAQLLGYDQRTPLFSYVHNNPRAITAISNAVEHYFHEYPTEQHILLENFHFCIEGYNQASVWKIRDFCFLCCHTIATEGVVFKKLEYAYFEKESTKMRESYLRSVCAQTDSKNAFLYIILRETPPFSQAFWQSQNNEQISMLILAYKDFQILQEFTSFEPRVAHHIKESLKALLQSQKADQITPQQRFIVEGLIQDSTAK